MRPGTDNVSHPRPHKTTNRFLRPMVNLTLSPDGELVRESLVDLLMEPTPILRKSLFFLFEPHEFNGGLGRIHDR